LGIVATAAKAVGKRPRRWGLISANILVLVVVAALFAAPRFVEDPEWVFPQFAFVLLGPLLAFWLIQVTSLPGIGHTVTKPPERRSQYVGWKPTLPLLSAAEDGEDAAHAIDVIARASPARSRFTPGYGSG
jgi:hypothetical protein